VVFKSLFKANMVTESWNKLRPSASKSLQWSPSHLRRCYIPYSANTQPKWVIWKSIKLIRVEK